jgi:hypothetical protein
MCKRVFYAPPSFIRLKRKETVEPSAINSTRGQEYSGSFFTACFCSLQPRPAISSKVALKQRSIFVRRHLPQDTEREIGIDSQDFCRLPSGFFFPTELTVTYRQKAVGS